MFLLQRFIHKQPTGRGLLTQNLLARKPLVKCLISKVFYKLSTSKGLLNNNNKIYIFNIY